MFLKFSLHMLGKNYQKQLIIKCGDTAILNVIV